MDIHPPDSFFTLCAEQGLELSGGEVDVLTRYVGRLLEVNQRMNLTAVRDAEGVWIRHVFDSLTLKPVLKGDAGQRGLDLGSGGGFPGIPLAVVRPDIEWVLVDSVGKKAKFLEETAGWLGLGNVGVSMERAEVLGRDAGYREQFHVVTARAVARLPTLLELTVPLLRVKGRLLAMKGQQGEQELAESRRAMELLGVSVRRNEASPGGGRLLVFRKQEATAGRFPRAVGVPGKEPL